MLLRQERARVSPAPADRICSSRSPTTTPFRAGTGNGTVDGRNADGTLYGVPGDDVMGGGNGADHLYGEAGNDTDYGETLLGSADPATTTSTGQSGNDVVSDVDGGDTDTMSGGAGNDSINVRDGAGGDTANGGLGSDTCTVDAGATTSSC